MDDFKRASKKEYIKFYWCYVHKGRLYEDGLSWKLDKKAIRRTARRRLKQEDVSRTED